MDAIARQPEASGKSKLLCLSLLHLKMLHFFAVVVALIAVIAI
jgi:hypothetical protein